MDDPTFSKKYDRSLDLSQVLEHKTNRLKEITRLCTEIQLKKASNNIKSADDLLDDLTISSLRDLCEYANGTGLSKATFKDMVQYRKLKKEGEDIVETKEGLISEVKISQIELIQAQIDVLLSGAKDNEI